MRLRTIRNSTIDRPCSRGRFILALAGVVALGMHMPEIPTNDPPQPPLKRVEGRIYEMRVAVQNKSRSLGWPLILQSNWCQVAPDSISAVNQTSEQIKFTAAEVKDDPRQWRLRFQDKNYTIDFQALAYSSVLNNAAANSISWPESWDELHEYYLEPSRFIESDDSIFQQAVADNGDPKSVSIHVAAKVLIRYCLVKIGSDGQYTKTKEGTTTGLDLKGARSAVKNEGGSASDLVCVCVATLRAAGIPARPVVGVTNADKIGDEDIEPKYIVWGEYALPGAGWVPFMPERMRGTVDNLPRTDAWQGLGTLPRLNRRIPLSYNFNCYDIDRSNQSLQMFFESSPTQYQ
jgi:hypothetical protein